MELGSTLIRLPNFVMGISVEKVLEDGADAMESGGTLAPAADIVNNLGGGAYNIGFRIGIFLAMLAFIGAGIGLMFAGSNSREDAKKKILYVIGGVFLVVGAAGLVVAISGIGANLFTL